MHQAHNPAPVNVRKPFVVLLHKGTTVAVPKPKRWAVFCEGPGEDAHGFANTCVLVTFQTKPEAQRLADTLNAAFANHFNC